MDKARIGHIILQSTDYQENRHRIYRVVDKIDSAAPLYEVTCCDAFPKVDLLLKIAKNLSFGKQVALCDL